MRTYTADELFKMAAQYEAKLTDPLNTDDPKWIQRRADRIRKLACQKRKAKRQKERESA